MAAYRSVKDAEVAGRRVLVRVDLNVPLKDGKVADATRIERAAPTIADLAARGAKVILLSHFGRPEGTRVAKMSLAPVVPAVAAVIGRPVAFAEDCIGPAAEKAVAAMHDGDVLLLENTRFHKGEEQNDAKFAAHLAALGDTYVNDAFSAAHRAHASTEALAHLLPAYAGLAMQAELVALAAALTDPARPLLAIVGGAKVSTKLKLLENLVTQVDFLVIGGAMANTFLLADGISVGRSLVEADMVDTVHAIQDQRPRRADFTLVNDVVVAEELAPGQQATTVSITAIPDDAMVLDFGPATVSAIKRRIDEAATVVWNGPLGAFEVPPFERATLEVARHVAARTKEGALISVAGGGDTVAALNAAGVAADFTYVSTAGGAFLEWLEGRTLPGVAALAEASPPGLNAT